ncbi:MAG: S41 family peptidase [Saprospiraceae bacterium]
MENQNTGSQIRLPLLLAVALVLGIFIGQRLPRYDQDIVVSRSVISGTGAIDEILRYVQSKYVDTVDMEELRTESIDHLLSKLDPHSVYITPDELKAVEDEMSGEFEGVGIEFLMVDDTMQVVTPLAGGPSEAAGILAGDKIVSINDTTIAGTKIDNGLIYKKLRGKKGSHVKLGILRGIEKEQRYFDITRDIIPVHSVDVAYMLDAKNGYIKINRFTDRTYQEFMEGLRPLAEEKGLQNLIIDLRGNPGGYLEEATEILSQIFPEGKLLVYTKGRTEKVREYKSNGRARFNIQNVALLIDEGSASASEIMAGAVQDWDRGWIVGRRSYGKGLVQEQYPLSNGGGLRLTIARYYTPSGRCIQRDYKNDDDYAHEGERRLQNGELSDPSKAMIEDSTKYYTGFGRIVYGGGGVSPDVFIPLDTTYNNEYFVKLRQQLAQFVTRWMENADHKQFGSDATNFVQTWTVPESLLNELVAYGEKQGIKKNAAQLFDCQQELKTLLKARIGKNLFGNEALYMVLNDDDPAVEKALDLLKAGKQVARK